MCVAVVALSLAILLSCFITFIAFYCPVAFVNSYEHSKNGQLTDTDAAVKLIAKLTDAVVCQWVAPRQTLSSRAWRTDWLFVA